MTFTKGHVLSLLTSIALFATVPWPASATLNFQRQTDVLGAASTFQEGTGLPTRNFTISVTARSSSGRNDFSILYPDSSLFIYYYPATSATLDRVRFNLIFF